jgi:hypothetical protein
MGIKLRDRLDPPEAPVVKLDGKAFSLKVNNRDVRPLDSSYGISGFSGVSGYVGVPGTWRGISGYSGFSGINYGNYTSLT